MKELTNLLPYLVLWHWDIPGQNADPQWYMVALPTCTLSPENPHGQCLEDTHIKEEDLWCPVRGMKSSFLLVTHHILFFLLVLVTAAIIQQIWIWVRISVSYQRSQMVMKHTHWAIYRGTIPCPEQSSREVSILSSWQKKAAGHSTDWMLPATSPTNTYYWSTAVLQLFPLKKWSYEYVTECLCCTM